LCTATEKFPWSYDELIIAITPDASHPFLRKAGGLLSAALIQDTGTGKVLTWQDKINSEVKKPFSQSLTVESRHSPPPPPHTNQNHKKKTKKKTKKKKKKK
ncbi:hypothetical protein, partial [Escherichia coli]|uniref:hypothetical protein n=1 Tax=Escherichia coli TaxID=562 RepID=UPI001BB119A2